MIRGKCCQKNQKRGDINEDTMATKSNSFQTISQHTTRSQFSFEKINTKAADSRLAQ
jgi:hypothetical protein